MITRTDADGTVWVLTHADGRLVCTGDVLVRLDDPHARRVVLGLSSVFGQKYVKSYAVDSHDRVYTDRDNDPCVHTLTAADYGLEWREL